MVNPTAYRECVASTHTIMQELLQAAANVRHTLEHNEPDRRCAGIMGRLELALLKATHNVALQINQRCARTSRSPSCSIDESVLALFRLVSKCFSVASTAGQNS
jgi:hypothetical protein